MTNQWQKQNKEERKVREYYFPNFRLFVEVIRSATESEFELRATRGRGRAACTGSASRRRRSRTQPALPPHFRRRWADEEVLAALVTRMVLPRRPRRRCLSPAIPRHPQLTAMLALSSAAVPRHRLRLPGVSPLRGSLGAWSAPPPPLVGN